LFAASATISVGVKEALFSFNNCHSFLLTSEIEAPVSTIQSLDFPFIWASTMRVFLLLAGEIVDNLILDCVSLFGFSGCSNVDLGFVQLP
jgi:hypothetical protein